MDDESGDGWGEIKWLPEDPPTPMDPARVIGPSLTNLARHSPSVIALSTIGPRRTQAMPLDDPEHSCGPEHGTSPRDSLPASFPANKLPATLIRTLDGRICAWSHGMESRYGFPARRAIGLIPHQLLRTISCQTLDEINRELLDQQTWSGGLVHYRSDGHPIMTANSWHLHRKFNSEARFVTEVHADIVSTGSVVEAHFADALESVVHEITEALTAARVITMASRRALRLARPDHVLCDRGLARTTKQLARATKTVQLMRKLSEQLRDRSGLA